MCSSTIYSAREAGVNGIPGATRGLALRSPPGDLNVRRAWGPVAARCVGPPFAPDYRIRARRSLSEFVTTETEENAIANAANTGLSRMPNAG
jgi:hypothetical protein